MKLLIIEGLDNVGKNFLVSGLSSNFDNFCVRHFTSPPRGLSEEDAISNQKREFFREFLFYQKMSEWEELSSTGRELSSLYVWNRSHLGEIVYGNIYRGYDATPWVISLEDHFSFDVIEDVYLLLMTSSDPEFLIRKDDGKSFSIEREKKEREMFLFNEAFSKSKIKKKCYLEVNTPSGEYLSAESIREKVMNFLNDK
jgi:hypothetical protein